MSKAKKTSKLKKVRQLSLLLFLAFFILGFVVYNHFNSTTINPTLISGADNAHLNPNKECTDFEEVMTATKHTTLEKYIIDENERNDGNISAMSVTWQRKSTEPLLTYNSERSGELYIKIKKVEQVKNILAAELRSYFSERGYRSSDLNTRNYKVDYMEYPDRAIVGYIKDNKFYTFSIDMSQYKVVNNKEVDLPRNTVGIYVQCASIEPELDKLYTDLLKNPETWLEKPSELPSTLAIWKNMDNLVMVETGGAASWVTKINGEWKSLYWGQDYPDCAVIETKKIGRGFECNRKNADDSYMTSTVSF